MFLPFSLLLCNLAPAGSSEFSQLPVTFYSPWSCFVDAATKYPSIVSSVHVYQINFLCHFVYTVTIEHMTL